MKTLSSRESSASILYLRGHNGIRAEAARWNHIRTSPRKYCMFMCSIIKVVIQSQIAWSSRSEGQLCPAETSSPRGTWDMSMVQSAKHSDREELITLHVLTAGRS